MIELHKDQIVHHYEIGAHTHITYVYIYIHIHAYTYIYIHIHTHTYTHTYIYIYINTHIYIYIYTHTYMFFKSGNAPFRRAILGIHRSLAKSALKGLSNHIKQ